MEPSTRTRSSFELAGKYLGADVINLSQVALLWVKVKASRYIVNNVLHEHRYYRNAPQRRRCTFTYATKAVDPIIINAGDGAREHPTQALLDMYSILEKKNL